MASEELTDQKFNARRGGGLPTYFRAHLMTAQQGGAESYRTAGWHLGLHRSREYSDELQGVGILRGDGEKQAEKELDDLLHLGVEWSGRHAYLNPPHLDRVVAWLGRWLPDFIEAVPAARRQTFARGFVAAVEERG